MSRFKVVKLNKKDLQKTPEALLRKLKVVDEKAKKAFPEHVFLSLKDYDTLKSNLRKRYRKEKPYLRKKNLDFAVGIHLLGFGPNTTIGGVIKPGYAIVDMDGVKDQKTVYDTYRNVKSETERLAMGLPKEGCPATDCSQETKSCCGGCKPESGTDITKEQVDNLSKAISNVAYEENRSIGQTISSFFKKVF